MISANATRTLRDNHIERSYLNALKDIECRAFSVTFDCKNNSLRMTASDGYGRVLKEYFSYDTSLSSDFLLKLYYRDGEFFAPGEYKAKIGD
jgi:hypothetical protein